MTMGGRNTLLLLLLLLILFVPWYLYFQSIELIDIYTVCIKHSCNKKLNTFIMSNYNEIESQIDMATPKTNTNIVDTLSDKTKLSFFLFLCDKYQF